MKFEETLGNGKHSGLSRLGGDWAGTAKTWFEPGKVVDATLEQA